MYRASVPVFVHTLGNCAGFQHEAAAGARERGLADAELLEARLHPDMFGLGRQVQIAVDGANGAAARLAGIDPAEFEDSAYAAFNRGSDAGFGPASRPSAPIRRRDSPVPRCGPSSSP